MAKTIYEIALEVYPSDSSNSELDCCRTLERAAFRFGANAVLDRLKHHLERIDVDNHSDDDLEDLYNALCEMVKNFKGE